jgi:pantetheine-phosphate adenylyltransferase
MSKKALFAGSFDPFTKGHQNIVDRALQSVADEVVIAIGINRDKHSTFSCEERLQAIRKLYKDNPNVQVDTYEGLTTDYAQRIGADFLLRGVRSVKDFEFERDIAEVNKRLTGIETVLLFTAPEYACISSSVVRELMSHNTNVNDFLPTT